MEKAKSWEVTDDFWEPVGPLIPVRQRLSGQTYTRNAGGGSVQQGSSSMYDSFAFCEHRKAADRRLYGHLFAKSFLMTVSRAWNL